ncbi:response regulator [Sphingomonas edaphi]|uniref:Response regulator n=1 Tax=Sphingomonas edaphi TaxID=2315689 RepID=A0A418PXR2_9SPHN|nr:response regulator [Sphingomonas edaphi]RIX27000.1 response regulator [Sphingomonas edaphi]
MTDRVLYVDDEDDIREIAAMALELDLDFEVRTCASGKDAIALVCDWQPDIILLDVMMPEMDGPTTFGILQARMLEDLPPVLFCTARTQAADVATYLRLGAEGVVPKPFDPMTLAATVRAHLAK